VCSENMKQLLVCSVVFLLCGKFKKPKKKECNQLWKLKTYSDTTKPAIILNTELAQTIGG